MLGTILKILLFFIVLRMIYPVFKGIGSLFGSSSPTKKKTATGSKKNDYSDLTPYEIEDAEFEEIREK